MINEFIYTTMVTAGVSTILAGGEALVKSYHRAYDKKQEMELRKARRRGRKAREDYEKQVWEQRKQYLAEKNREERRRLIQAEIDKKMNQGA